MIAQQLVDAFLGQENLVAGGVCFDACQVGMLPAVVADFAAIGDNGFPDFLVRIADLGAQNKPGDRDVVLQAQIMHLAQHIGVVDIIHRDGNAFFLPAAVIDQKFRGISECGGCNQHHAQRKSSNADNTFHGRYLRAYRSFLLV